MANGRISRREMLLYSSCGAVLANSAALPNHPPKHQHSTETRHDLPASFQFFTGEEASDVDEITELIIPADETPGARAAGVVHFIDRALTTFDHDKQERYRAGLRDLRAKVRAVSPTARKLADLTEDQQAKLLSELENSDFFALIRTHTLMGFFGNESYGGNRHQIGWKLIGFEDKFTFLPPFGNYDVQPDHTSK